MAAPLHQRLGSDSSSLKGQNGAHAPLRRLSAWVCSLLLLGCSGLLAEQDKVLQGTCDSHTQCAPGYECLLGQCRAQCEADDECDAGSRCLKTASSMACVPATAGCDPGCPEGTRCEDGVCRSKCSSALQCAIGQACLEQVCVGTDAAHDPIDPAPRANSGDLTNAPGSANSADAPDSGISSADAGSPGLMSTDEPDSASDAGALNHQDLNRQDAAPPQQDSEAPQTEDCPVPGQIRCLGVAQKERQQCTAGRWQSFEPCGSDENCSQATGMCRPILPQCAEHADATEFCSEPDLLETCDVDLVESTTTPCEGRCTELMSSAECTPTRCGDGQLDANEECDDGNTDNQDGCTSACTLALCGDGAVWQGHEACDDGNRVDDDGCSNDCRQGDGGSCQSNDDCVNTCVAEQCVPMPALNGSCDDDDDCSQTEAPGCAAGQCSCEQANCGSSCVDLTVSTEHCGACDHSCLGGGCLNGECEAIVLATGQSNPRRIAVNQAGIFWTNFELAGQVMKVNHDGTGLTTLVDNVSSPYGIAVDDSYVYYSAGRDLGFVNRVPISGGAPVTLATGIVTPRELTLVDGIIYYTGYGLGVGRVNTDGGEQSLLWAGTGSLGITFGTDSLFVTNNDVKTIYEVSTDGSSANDLMTGAGGASVAFHDQTLYFTGDSWVSALPVAGGSIGQVANKQLSPSVVVADDSGVYWTNYDAMGSVMRAKAGSVDTLAAEQWLPTGITLDAEAIYWVNRGNGQVMKLAK